VNELREDLDRALRALPVNEAPVERARRDGRRLRARRRLGLLAGAVAVAAVAAGYPALAHGTASAPPAPVTGRPYGGDPVLTDGPPAAAQQQSTGLTSGSGIIAEGAVGVSRWQLTVLSGPLAEQAGETCFVAINLTGGSQLGPNCGTGPGLVGDLNGNPAGFLDLTDDNGNVVVIGQAAANVTYFILTFTDGQRLKLLPVTVGGYRYIGWEAPPGMAIRQLEAHLGGPYSASGQVSAAVPYQPAGQTPTFGRWQRAGQTAPPRDSQVIGTGSGDGPSWSVSAAEGPWGTCFVAAVGRDCLEGSHFTTTQVLGGFGRTYAQFRFGSAAPGVVTVRIALSNGTTAVVHPVGVGDEYLFAFSTGPGVTPQHWTAYAQDGSQVGQGTVRQ